MKERFWKYQGAGNDFLLFEREVLPSDPASWAKRACHRRLGVGGDGILFLLPSERADVRMRIFNADGSEAEMCGNGLRCIALHAWSRGRAERSMEVETDAGVKQCRVADDAGAASGSVRLSLGRPALERESLPMSGNGRCVAEAFSLPEGRELRITALSMGNPHVVVFIEDADEDELVRMAGRFGPIMENHSAFPNRTNVSFVRPLGGGEFSAIVWERGCGLTAACGTGAGAIGTAACLEGRADLGKDLRIHLPGGVLVVQVAQDYREVLLEGPADLAFEGTVDPLELPEPRWMPI